MVHLKGLSFKILKLKQMNAEHPKNTIATVKHRGGNIMLWDSVSAKGEKTIDLYQGKDEWGRVK